MKGTLEGSLMTQATPAPASPLRKYRGLIIAAVVLLLPSAVIGYWLLTLEEDVSLLKRSDYEAAVRKWDDSGIMSYDLDLAFSGGDQIRYIHLEVRDGQVTECLQNGQSPSNKANWDDWTINKQFAMIGDDLNKAERPGGFAVRSNVTITLHADFDPEYGFPRSYWRKARGNTPLQSKWRVVEFKRMPDGGTNQKAAAQ
jgi:hypothetical protein